MKKQEEKKPLKIKYNQKVAMDMSELYLNPKSVLHCAKCETRLGVLRTLRHALFKPQGAKYKVPCPHCGYLNLRVKGAFKDDTEKKWRGVQAELDKDAERKP
jgi:hypothetical protein